MKKISLTDLVDIASAGGKPKATKVKNVKTRDDYQPAFDYYKQMRDSIIRNHKNNGTRTTLDAEVGFVKGNKRVNYNLIEKGYRKWWGKKVLNWFDPPRGVYSFRDVEVSINPELGLEVNGTKHLVKLYFKPDHLTKNRVEIISHAMYEALKDDLESGTCLSILDIRNSKLISPAVPIDGMNGILAAELAYVSTLWDEY